MAKSLYIAEKPSVAQEFANALKKNWRRGDGFLEAQDSIVTWCVGHLVTMSYPEAYDPKYRRWSLETLPFLPREFKYEVIDHVSRQFHMVSSLLNRQDVDTIYICTDSGREGEYIYRLVDQMAGVCGKVRKRVWIDSQTEEEILRGIREARDWSCYDNLSASAYLRAKEDYLMGINFSRLLTLKYGNAISSYLRTDRAVLSVGRVMTCVLGMAVRREREVRSFVKTPFYRVLGTFLATGASGGPGAGPDGAAPVQGQGGAGPGGVAPVQEQGGAWSDGAALGQTATGSDGAALGQAGAGQAMSFEGEWRCAEGSRYFGTPFLYKENGFKERRHAQELIDVLSENPPLKAVLAKVERKKETKNPPLLFNLAELQNDCSKMFKISPDETLKIAQELYEKKLVTYPRTDARVLSSAVAKEIHKNISGLKNFRTLEAFASEVLEGGRWKGIGKTRYVDDRQITDHYAIIPTGQGFSALGRLASLQLKVYEAIARRFLAIFYPPAVYQKHSLDLVRMTEHFFASFRILSERGYLKVAEAPQSAQGKATEGPQSAQGRASDAPQSPRGKKEKEDEFQKNVDNPEFIRMLGSLKKGMELDVRGFAIKEGETSPPRRYTSGSMILAMENAGQLIEDEELRAQIRGSGIGTSATRAEILKKLVNIRYLALNGKTQVITPTLLGEMVFDVVNASIRQLLNPDLTASWEKGLAYVAQGSITSEEYMEKLERFVAGRTGNVLRLNNQWQMREYFDAAAQYYKNGDGDEAQEKTGKE